MKRYRKKPVEIEAVQLPVETFSSDVIVATEAKLAFEDVLKEFSKGTYTDWRWRGGDFRGISIPTLEGEILASPGDWIIRGVNGEFYPCKPDIFEKTYEGVINGE